MIRLLAAIGIALLCAGPAVADIVPQPGPANPRIQTARWQRGETVQLTMLPRSALTVMLEPGERIHSVSVNDQAMWHVNVTAEEDSLQVEPQGDGPPGTMLVSTDRREYRFGLRTETSLLAAYLVRFVWSELPPTSSFTPGSPPIAAPAPIAVPQTSVGEWRMKGDRSVRPASISDDGTRIRIAFDPQQALPAVFAVGPTGGEEVVNGYMRGDAYVIDRIYDELVFRIDRERATARRDAASK